MNHLNPTPDERISALVDGCLHGEECTQTIHEILSQPQAMETWHAFHVVGDVLRSAELAPTADDLAFWGKLERRLVQEHATVDMVGVEVVVPTSLRSAGNASVFRWKLVAGVACTVLVGVVGVGWWSLANPPADARMAVLDASTRQASAVATQSLAAGMIRDPQLDALMAAHQQFGGHSALQVPAGFLRNATFERPVR